MLADGIYVLLNGKYIGPDKPGPWSLLFTKLNIDVFKLGPLFIGYGLLWLIWIVIFWNGSSWTYLTGLVIALGTLWYLPVGTFFSLIIVFCLLVFRTKLGL